MDTEFQRCLRGPAPTCQHNSAGRSGNSLIGIGRQFQARKSPVLRQRNITRAPRKRLKATQSRFAGCGSRQVHYGCCTGKIHYSSQAFSKTWRAGQAVPVPGTQSCASLATQTFDRCGRKESEKRRCTAMRVLLHALWENARSFTRF